MGSNKGHFNVSLIVRGKVTKIVSINDNIEDIWVLVITAGEVIFVRRIYIHKILKKTRKKDPASVRKNKEMTVACLPFSQLLFCF